MSGTNPAYAEPSDQVFREWTGKLQQTIREAQAGGGIREDVPHITENPMTTYKTEAERERFI